MTAKRGSAYPAMALTSQAAPPPPPAKRMGAGAKILVLLIVVGIILVGLWYFGIFTPTVKVTAANWTIDYGGSILHWFSGSPSVACTACPITTLAGATFTLTFTLEANAFMGNHPVDNVTIAAPFTFASISPALPYTVNAGQTRSFIVSIKAPTTGGDYILSGTIETS